MSHTNTIAQIEIAWHLWKEKIQVKTIAKNLNVHRATVYRWVFKWTNIGIKRTLEYYTNCKKHPRKKRISSGINDIVLQIRHSKHDCCGEKIRFFLHKKHGINVSTSTIYNILSKSSELKRRYKKWKFGEAPKGNYARDVVQADTVAFGEIFAYTYIDTFTRQAHVDLETGLDSADGYASLTSAKKIFKNIHLLQTDGGSEFQGEFKQKIKELAQEHRVSRPYRKNEQSFIESFNRTLRKECLGWGNCTTKQLPEMIAKLNNFLIYYNNERPHLGLNMKTPNEVAILSHLI